LWRFTPEVPEIEFPSQPYRLVFPDGNEPEAIHFWGHKPALDRIVNGYGRKSFSELLVVMDLIKELRASDSKKEPHPTTSAMHL